MKRIIAAALLLVLGAACHDSAEASSKKPDPNLALCAAAHAIPRVLLDFHHQRITQPVALGRLRHIRDTINDNAAGPRARHLRDLAAAVHVFEIVTKHRGDTGDAYRDLRTLRESLPPCSQPMIRSAVVRRPAATRAVTSG
jgi:hypothetical protein